MSAINIQKDLQYKQLSKGKIFKISFQVLKHALQCIISRYLSTLLLLNKYYFQLLYILYRYTIQQSNFTGTTEERLMVFIHNARD